MTKASLLIFAVGTVALTLVAAIAAKEKPEVTISLSQPVVTFGDSVTLSGSIRRHQAAAGSQQVEVLARQYGQAAAAAGGYVSIATVTPVTTASGVGWTYAASPTIETSYKAKWQTATSRSVTVKVRPQLTLTQVSLSGNRATFSVKAVASRSFAGRFVLVERRIPVGKAQPKKVVLGGDSSATFAIRVQRGNSRLRAVMPTSQTEPGYVATKSAVLTINR